MTPREIRSRWLFRQAIADEHGIRWQEKQSGEWHAAGWDEVEDFYTESRNEKNPGALPRSILRTRDGRKLTFDALWSNYERLREVIADRRLHAEIANRSTTSAVAERAPEYIGWSARGTRLTVPTSFIYSEEAIQKRLAVHNQKSRRAGWLLVGALGLGALCCQQAPFLTQLFFIFGGALFIPPFVQGTFQRPKARQIQEARERIQRGERFEVTRETLTVWQDGEKQAIPWADVVGYDEPVFTENLSLHDAVRIRTVGGKEFSFTPLMERAERFAEMLPLLARNAVAYRRGKNELAALGGVEQRWTGGEEGKGDRIFHRRTRRNLYDTLFLWCSPIIVVAYFLYAGIYAGISAPWLHSSTILFLILLTQFIYYLRIAFKRTRSYLHDRVILGKEAIRVIQAGKEKEFRWDAVSYRSSDANRITLYGKSGELLEFNPAEFAYGNELPELIGEYVERAKAEAERAAIAASDVAQPKPETRVWSEEEAHEAQPQKVMRNR